MTRVGIIGGGQLGRMMALAGIPLGLQFRFLDPAPDCPASQVGECVTGDYDDPNALARFAAGLDAVTYEFENVPVAALDFCERHAPIFPPREALAVSQDRLSEKQFFKELGIQTPRFAAVSSLSDLHYGMASIGLPAVLKTRRFGYDGKGQQVLRTLGDLEPAWSALSEYPCILEEMIAFDEEVSILAARSACGETIYYPSAHNSHRDGILRVSWADPTSGGQSALYDAATGAIGKLVAALDYVGVLALELFVRDGNIIANEMAPRVHNSGHWTIEGSPCSQFENHLRAGLGLPLGETFGDCPCGMVNLLSAAPETSAMLKVRGAHVHLYGKAPRPGRKIGHVTVLAETRAHLQERLAELRLLAERAS
jgi:5-(carboxyamino)imidazole ribonucleotide synthase